MTSMCNDNANVHDVIAVAYIWIGSPPLRDLVGINIASNDQRYEDKCTILEPCPSTKEHREPVA
jgi:hypothetical protein